MRVLMVVPKYPYPVLGGLERQAHELATTLRRRGHTVVALSTAFDPRHPALEVVDGIRVHRVPWFDDAARRFTRLPVHLARALWRLRREVDVVHVHNISWFGGFATAIAKTLGLPVITKLPGSKEFGVASMQRARGGGLRVALLRASDAVVAMTADSAGELDDIAYPRGRVLRVPNGIRVTPLAPPAAPSATVGVVFVGRLSPEKGLSALLDAWATVQARARHRAHLRVIGDGPLEGELRARIAALGLDDVVELCGYRADVPAELARADVFVLPSDTEGNSNALLEAMRAGLPVVATRVGGAAAQVGEEGAHLLVAPGDRAALAARLLALVDDPDERRRVGAAMRARLERWFDIERIASRYLRAYELLRQRRPDELGGLDRGAAAPGGD